MSISLEMLKNNEKTTTKQKKSDSWVKILAYFRKND